MAIPQKENGYTPIANEIMEALARIRIPGEARQMLDVIIRKTYGFNKKIDQIATSQFMELTGLPNFSIHRARKRLLYAKMITVSKNANSQILSYSFQKDYHKWVTVCKNAQCAKKSSTISKNANNCMQKQSPTVSVIAIHKRHKDTFTKDNIQKTKEIDHPLLKNEVFNKTFKDFLELRVKMRRPATDRTKELLLAKLSGYAIETAIAMLEQSIMNSWQGVFELKKENDNGRRERSISKDTENKYAGVTKEIQV